MKTAYFPLTGRFGNLLFQYCWARAYCEANGLQLCLHPWVGEKVFQIPLAARPPATINLAEDTHQRQSSLIYTRKQVRQWLKFKPEVEDKLSCLLRNRKTVMLDWRKGDDYLGAGLVSLGSGAYLDAAEKFGFVDPTDYEWEVDTESTRLPEFQGDVTASGFNTTWVSLPAFYRLMTAKVHFRANSTFSWWAATLGNARVFSPVIRGVRGGVRWAWADFVEGNWPVMADTGVNTDLHLREE